MVATMPTMAMPAVARLFGIIRESVVKVGQPMAAHIDIGLSDPGMPPVAALGADGRPIYCPCPNP
jgi:hypothetical protein